MGLMTKRRSVKFVVGAAATSVILVGLGAAGAVAASRALSPSEESKAVIEDAAGQLGVEPDALSDALKQALKNRVDAAVEAGRLTEAQGAELKKRIDSEDGVPLFGGMRPGGHGPDHAGPFGSLDAAAAYLGLTEVELRDELADQTLAEIATEKGKSVDALTTAAEKKIDEAVAEGRLTQDQATELKADLDERIKSLVNGEFRGHGGGFHPGFGPGGISPRGPPGFEGSHA